MDDIFSFPMNVPPLKSAHGQQSAEPTALRLFMDATTYEQSATAEYLKVIRQYVIHPLRDDSVGESCFAAAMLLFAAMDGLGRLIHPEPRALVRERFQLFVSRLGEAYASRKVALWKLRNSLDHNALNVACFMSKTVEAEGEHLEVARGYVFIHTKILLDDFETALSQLEKEFVENPTLFERAQSRLQWAGIDRAGWRGESESNGIVIRTTPPAPIWFVEEL